MGNLIDSLVFPVPQVSINAWNGLNCDVGGIKCELFTLHYVNDGGEACSSDYVECTPQDVNTSRLKTIVVCHGNGSDIFDMQMWYVELAHNLKVRVIGVEYIGYGPAKYRQQFSSGSSTFAQYRIMPSEQGCYKSLDAVMTQIEKDYGLAETYLLGHSLGTGVVVDYVAKHGTTNPIILISPYKSIARTQVDSIFVYGVDRFRTWYKLKYLKCPVKIFHGQMDDLIKWHHSRDIFAKLPDQSLKPTYYKTGTHDNMLSKIKFEEIGVVIGTNLPNVSTFDQSASSSNATN